MEHHHLLQHPSEVSDLMPRKLQWRQELFSWKFLSEIPNDELEYQRTIFSIMSAAHVIPSSTRVPPFPYSPYMYPCLIQVWVPIKVDGLTFLSIADQPFILNMKLDKSLCSYRKLCLNTLIPIDKYNEQLLGPPGRVFRTRSPEFNLDVPSYLAAEFPLREDAIRWGIHSYYAFPLLKSTDDHQCVGVFEVVSTEPFDYVPRFIKGVTQDGSLYSLQPIHSYTKVDNRLVELGMGLDEILEIYSLPFAQIWIPSSESFPFKDLICPGVSSYKYSNLMYFEFERVSKACIMESGKGLVGRAFASQGSCFCKDVTLLSLQEYPLVPAARKARLTQSFAICLQSKSDNNVVYVIEYFLPPNETDARGIETFLNMLLSTMKEQLPGLIVASGQELGQKMRVDVVKVSPSDELDSFEIGQPLPNVQSLQNGGETTENDSCWQHSNLQNDEGNVATAILVPSCSSQECDSLNCEATAEVEPLLHHPIVEAVANRGTSNVNVTHDEQIEFEKDTGEIMQVDKHVEQTSAEIDSTANVGSNDNLENFTSVAASSIQKTDSHKDDKILQIRKDHGITRELLVQQFGKTREDAAKSLSVSTSTLKRICREYEISRWPHHKTRKAYHNFNQGISLQSAEPYVRDQQCPNLSQEKATNSNKHQRSHSEGKPCNDNVMSVKVTYKDIIIKFKLTPSATMVELQGEVEKRLSIPLQRFSIRYHDDEDDELITIAVDSDLREHMHEIRLSGKTTMKLVVIPQSDT